MIEQDQYEFLNDRIDHEASERDALAARVLALESAKEVKKARVLEWIVIVLIIVEIAESWFLFHHG